MIFLQSFMIKLGACGRLHVPETENKTCQISGLKSGHRHLRNLTSGRLQESFINSIWLRNKNIVFKVVA